MGEPKDERKLEPKDEPMECLKWLLMVSLSPLALVLFILMALKGLLGFLSKVALLSTIVAINTPFAAMYNMSILVFQYCNHDHFQNFKTRWNRQDSRSSVAIEIKLFVADFLKVVAGEFLVVVSTGIITFFTAPDYVFYISMVVGVIVIFHKWLNMNCLSRTALSCLCDGHGLSPLTFLCSYIGFFDIGCHPVAKCSFAARRAFLFVENRVDVNEGDTLLVNDEADVEEGARQLDEKERPKKCMKASCFDRNGDKETRTLACEDCEEGKGGKECNAEANQHRWKRAPIDPKNWPIEFREWNVFDRDKVFRLNPKIEFTEEMGRNYILKSCMVLEVFGKKICEYHVERLELPEDYSKAIALNKFLLTLSEKDGFVTDKMIGQYEHSMTLSQIVEGVEKNSGYIIREPMDNVFVVVGTCSDL